MNVTHRQSLSRERRLDDKIHSELVTIPFSADLSFCTRRKSVVGHLSHSGVTHVQLRLRVTGVFWKRFRCDIANGISEGFIRSNSAAVSRRGTAQKLTQSQR